MRPILLAWIILTAGGCAKEKTVRSTTVATARLVARSGPVAASEPEAELDPTAEKHMRALVADPAGSREAVRWFESLPPERRLRLAGSWGTVLLTSGSSFVAGFGATGSPYPWVVISDSEGLRLSGGNTFLMTYRNDAAVRDTWGEYWVSEVSYDRVDEGAGPLFVPPTSWGPPGSDLWIPGTSWKYVGPPLERNPKVLGRR